MRFKNSVWTVGPKRAFNPAAAPGLSQPINLCIFVRELVTKLRKTRSDELCKKYVSHIAVTS